METAVNVFLGKKRDVYYLDMISSTTVTLMELVSLVDKNNYREAFMVLLLLSDAIPNYIA